jgi:oligogalacturonide lyase
MKKIFCIVLWFICFPTMIPAQIGQHFPSERKLIKDPVTGAELIFLTSQQGAGDAKIYQTHNQWTADGQWLIFRSNRVPGEAMAVHETTGEMVQVTEGGYTGMLNVGRKNMTLHFMRLIDAEGKPVGMRRGAGDGRVEIVEVDLEKLFADSRSGTLKDASYYQKVCGTTPASIGAGGDMAVDANEDVAYFRVSKEEALRHLPAETKIEENFGPRNMGAGPSGIAGMNLKTGEIKHVVSVPFQIGHIQTNPWVPGEIVFCWETGGKAPVRMWTVKAGGTGLRPVYHELEADWVTHEAVITPDEVAFAIMGHRPVGSQGFDGGTTNPGQESGWGPSGTRAHLGGLAIADLRTGEVYLAGQTKSGSGLWHVSGSADGRFAAGDDFKRDIWLIDRRTNEMMLLSAGHKTTAADHPHPTFSPDGTKIQIQSAMLSEDNRSMNILVIKVPQEWTDRK